MPNYVYNKLKVEGGLENIDIFTEGHLDFNQIIPMPLELKDTESGSRNHDGLIILYKETKSAIEKGINCNKNKKKLIQRNINKGEKINKSTQKKLELVIIASASDIYAQEFDYIKT